jgi:hypothetical protein
MKMKLQLTIGLALVALAATLLADNKRMKFGSGSEPHACFIDTNLFVCWGMAPSNAAVAGNIWTDTTATANPTSNGTPATVTSTVVPSTALLNNGDSIVFSARGIMPAAQANTNQLVIVYGSTTILDTGLQIASNTAYRVEATLTRTADVGLLISSRCEWGPGGGVPFVFTNNVAAIAETNTVNTTLALQATARRQGSLTNMWTSLQWHPAGK